LPAQTAVAPEMNFVTAPWSGHGQEALVELGTGSDAGLSGTGRREKSSIVPMSLSDIESPEVRSIERAWQKWRGFHAMPARESLVPRDLGRFMANVSLVRVLDDGDDYEFRIIGDAHLRCMARILPECTCAMSSRRRQVSGGSLKPRTTLFAQPAALMRFTAWSATTLRKPAFHRSRHVICHWDSARLR